MRHRLLHLYSCSDACNTGIISLSLPSHSVVRSNDGTCMSQTKCCLNFHVYQFNWEPILEQICEIDCELYNVFNYLAGNKLIKASFE